MHYDFRVSRTEKNFEAATIRVEADTEEAARRKLAEHLSENGTEEDLDGDQIEWEFFEGSTMDWEIGEARRVRL